MGAAVVISNPRGYAAAGGMEGAAVVMSKPPGYAAAGGMEGATVVMSKPPGYAAAGGRTRSWHDVQRPKVGSWGPVS